MPPPAIRETPRSRASRIPATLQAVFLASNRGKTVDKPPPKQASSKVFFRNWLFQRQTKGAEEKEKKTGFFGRRKQNKKQVEKKAVPKKVDLSKNKLPTPSLSPQAYLDAMIRSNGYSTKRFKTLQSAYYNKPTPLQNASYDVYLIDVVKAYDYDLLKSMMSAGLSPNPCNTFGESLVHTVSRRGDSKALQILIDHGCTVQAADDYGRTPLHDACWAAIPAFDVADIILKKDPRMLFMTDSRGATPLAYVRKDHWAAWIEYLEVKKKHFWPVRDLQTLGEEGMPQLFATGPNSCPMVNPPGALTLQLAAMVSSGKMRPEEASYLKYEKREGSTAADLSIDDSDVDSDFDSDYSDSDDDYSLDENEMADILNSIAQPRARPVVRA